MPGGGLNRKITQEHRDELLRLHLAGDREGATQLALSLGLHRDYARTYASARGFKPLIRPTPTQHRWVNQ